MGKTFMCFLGILAFNIFFPKLAAEEQARIEQFADGPPILLRGISSNGKLFLRAYDLSDQLRISYQDYDRAFFGDPRDFQCLQYWQCRGYLYTTCIDTIVKPQRGLFIKQYKIGEKAKLAPVGDFPWAPPGYSMEDSAMGYDASSIRLIGDKLFIRVCAKKEDVNFEYVNSYTNLLLTFSIADPLRPILLKVTEVDDLLKLTEFSELTIPTLLSCDSITESTVKTVQAVKGLLKAKSIQLYGGGACFFGGALLVDKWIVDPSGKEVLPSPFNAMRITGGNSPAIEMPERKLVIYKTDTGVDFYDMADPLRPKLVKRASEGEVAFIDAFFGSRGRVFGDILAFASPSPEEHFITRWRLDNNYSLSPLCDPDDFRAAMRKGDIAAMRRLAMGQVDIFRNEGSCPLYLECLDINDARIVDATLRVAMEVSSFASGEVNINPVIMMIDKGKLKLIPGAIKLNPKWLDARNSTYRGYGLAPVFHAVSTDNLNAVKILVSLGANVKRKISGIGCPSNALSFARSQNMITYLESIGVPSTLLIDPSVSAVCNDNGVRIREKPSTDGEIVGKLENGDKVLLLAATSDEPKVGNSNARWYRVKTVSGTIGWSFGSFFRIPSWDRDRE